LAQWFCKRALIRVKVFVTKGPICLLGAFYGIPAADEETSYKIYDAYAAAGGNFIDTADIYGDSEEVLGK
jgi:aryl-alcohol dehydrogenase-like predicted oxidoreductase